jgi:hypothetical protein
VINDGSGVSGPLADELPRVWVAPGRGQDGLRFRFDLDSPPREEDERGSQGVVEYERRFRNAPAVVRQGAIDRRVTLPGGYDSTM